MIRRRPSADVVGVALLVALVAGIEVAVRHAALRPLWYDELWRAHYLSVPVGDFWSEIRRANAPSALGWALVSRVAGEVLGWHPWALRLPQLVTLPLLSAETYLLTRRFTSPAAAFVAGALIGVSGTVVDLGTQFKPYTVEALCAVAVLGLWLWRPTGTSTTGRRVAARTVAGALTVFTVPLAFLIGPLAVADVLLVRGGWRMRLRAAAEAGPAVVLTAAHALLFVARQSTQRHGHYWDGQFLAGRSLAGGVRFIGHQLLLLAGSAPPGVDRSDPNLVHTLTDGTPVELWVLAPGFAVALLLGARVLARRNDGRVLLVALLGAELMELLASGYRYWPFGATRNNLFLVPLLTVVPAVGIADLLSRARRHRPLVPAAAALVAVTVVALVSSTSATTRLFVHQRDPRLIDRLGVAADAATRLAGPGDLTVVAGALVRAGWLYSTGVRADRAVNGSPSTVFVPFDGDGTLAQALAARPAPQQVLLFVLDLERDSEQPALTRLRAAGFCPVGRRTVPQTGQLTVLRSCSPNGPGA